jgi:two-component system response regulator HydG
MKLQGLLDRENFFQEVLDLIQKKFNYYSIHVWTVEKDLSAVLRAQAGAYLGHLKPGHVLGVGEGIIGYVIRSRQSYLTNDVANDPNYTNLSLPVRSCSQLTVPVLKDGAPVAVISVESDEATTLDEEDVITLEAVAAQLAVAIINQRLFSETKRFNLRLQEAVAEKTQELRAAQERILEQQRLLQNENKALKTLVGKQNFVADPIGSSPALLSVIQMVDKIAPTLVTVLIQGESGTGKELIARRLHSRSARSDQPYVTVNCGALQESLLESELFGHEKGSFTGAVAQKLGLCETADGGTLFLDEIGEMALGIQAKLLRFLQEGEFYRIGGKKPIRVDTRIVSATNRDLDAEVKAGRFREDLFYRLNTITLRMPPLRKRKEDLPALVDYFMRHSRFGGPEHIRRIDPRVFEAFQNHDWPGNIRELQNTVERLRILAENNEIRYEDLPANLRSARQNAADTSPEAPVAETSSEKSRELPPEVSLATPLDELEKNHILRSLAYHKGNKTQAARSLGITIKTLYNKLHRYGIPVGPAR